MTDKKYELLKDNTIIFEGCRLYRIRALKDINFTMTDQFDNEEIITFVKKGDLGGYIEKESNLSHNGTCWVYHKGKAFGSAHLCDNAKITDFGVLCDSAELHGYSHIGDKGVVGGNSLLLENVVVLGYAKIDGESLLKGSVRIGGNYQGTSIVLDKKQEGGILTEDISIAEYIRDNQQPLRHY